MVRTIAVPLALLALGACGRFNFDPLAGRGDGGGGDDDGAIDVAPTCALGPFGAPTTDPTINSSGTDWGPSLSSDGLTLIFSSSRLGGNDRLFVTTRATVASPWSTPTEIAEIAPGNITDDPSLSADELSLYWGFPAVQVATRPDKVSPWSTLGGTVVPASADHNALGGPDISRDGLTLYFTGSRNSDSTNHMYEAHRATTGDAFTSSSEIPGLTSADEYGSVRGDGLEIVFQHPGAGVDLDLFHATRTSTADAFGQITLIGGLSSPSDDGDIDLSDDGTTVWFASLRQGGQGSWDLWTATRACQ